MATGQKRTTNQRTTNQGRKRTTSNGKGNNKRSRTVHKATNEKKSMYRDEIILMVTLVISLLLILSNFNLSGIVGQYIKYFAFGFVGFLAYLLPFLLFFGVAFGVANKNNKSAIYKILNVSAVVVVFTAFIQLATYSYYSETSLLEIYNLSAKDKNGGGIIGGIILKLLCSLFGEVGTYVILLALLLTLTMFLTGKAIFRTLGAKSEASYLQMKEKRRLKEEEYEETSQQNVEEIQEKRKARTILFPKKDKSLEEANKATTHKGKDKLLKTGDSKNQNINMQEILPEQTEIPINRGNTEYTNAEPKFSYEEQLRQKFGDREGELKTENYESKESIVNQNNDMNRLLHAAMEDARLQEEHKDIEIGPFDGSNMDDSTLVEDEKYKNSESGNENINGSSNGKTSEDPYGNTSEDSYGNTSGGSNRSSAGRINGYANDDRVNNTGEGKDDNSIKINMSSKTQESKEYVFPPLNLLGKGKGNVKGMSDRDLKETALKLQKTLESFGVRVTITNVSCGPSVTRYELQPEQGVKVSKITGLADDIKLNLAAADVRIEAPIPGKAAVGIEVPNKENATVLFRELLESNEFVSHSSNIAFAVGKDIGGQTIVTDIGKMPHLLIAGATGSGKSVCINTLIMSILYKANPNDVKMIMVDPKVVELSVYNGIPHLLIPVVTDPKKASAALNWAVMEMTERYKKFADLGVRDVKGYNEKIATVEEFQDERYQKLPQIVIIVDELADLMMVAPGEVEDAICRLAQMARAAGLHLIIATQRPSVNVITGLIKANIPSRIAFSVSSAIDSRTIIDGSGAEKLLGKGDMLFFPSGYPKPVRVQGAFITDKEVSSVVEFLTNQNQAAEYSEEVVSKITSVQTVDSATGSTGNDRDEYFAEAGKFIIEKDKASIGMLQRVYKIGFNRAARIMDQLSEAGVVGPEEGTKPRKVLMTLEEFEQYIDEYV